MKTPIKDAASGNVVCELCSHVSDRHDKVKGPVCFYPAVRRWLCDECWKGLGLPKHIGAFLREMEQRVDEYDGPPLPRTF